MFVIGGNHADFHMERQFADELDVSIDDADEISLAKK